jgi:type II secretory pathway predicted ATPase ExeA
MSWYWLVPAGTTLLALVALFLALRSLTHEARRLAASIKALERVAVAVDDLGHEAGHLDRSLRRLSHR